jgi:hypothetical protein
LFPWVPIICAYSPTLRFHLSSFAAYETISGGEGIGLDVNTTNVFRGEAAHELLTHYLQSITIHSKMGRSSQQAAEIEANIQAAITAFQD